MSDEIEEIKRQHFDALSAREVILIVKHDYGYQVEHWQPDGVSPSSDYDTPQEAGARALQLLGVKEPVNPQSWPELAQIGGDGRAIPPRPKPRA